MKRLKSFRSPPPSGFRNRQSGHAALYADDQPAQFLHDGRKHDLINDNFCTSTPMTACSWKSVSKSVIPPAAMFRRRVRANQITLDGQDNMLLDSWQSRVEVSGNCFSGFRTLPTDQLQDSWRLDFEHLCRCDRMRGLHKIFIITVWNKNYLAVCKLNRF